MSSTNTKDPNAAVGLEGGTVIAVTRRARLAEFWYYFSQNRGAVIGLYVFLAIVVIALLAPVIAPHSPSLQNRGFFLLPPAWQEGGNWSFVLGTDAVGRDVLSRLIYGAQNTVGIAFVTTLLAFFIGISLGFLAATIGCDCPGLECLL